MSEHLKPETPEFWESRYQADKTVWDLWQPAPELAAWLESNPGHGQRALVLGCGRGYDAVAMAKSGYDVTAVDFAPSAIREAKALAESEAVSLQLLQEDLFELGPEFTSQFDLVFEHTLFCVLEPKQRGDYRSLVARLLRPGGRLFGIFFTDDDPDGPPYGVTPAELKALLEPDFQVKSIALSSRSVPRRTGEEHVGIFIRR